MKRLILFSGGVESTALVTIKQDTDVVITIEDTSTGERPSFHRPAILNIAEQLHFSVQFCSFTLPCVRNRMHFAYQLWSFACVAALWLTKDPAITEVWYGLNKSSIPEHDIHHPRKRFAQLEAGWNAWHPTIPLQFPLKDYTKIEQWKMIPDHIKPLVRTCVHNIYPERDVNCGHCHKCEELRLLKGSCLNPF